MNDVITRNEVLNDGRSVHLYFNGLVGLYACYGVSAFLACRLSGASPSYSSEMQMPVAVLNADRCGRLVLQGTLVRDVRGYRCVRVSSPVSDDEYAAWACRLRSGSPSSGSILPGDPL